MNIWICNQCQAEIPEKEKPETCPLCGQYSFGFDKGVRKDPGDEDKKFSQLYDEALKELEEYSEGCEPESMKYCCEG